MDRVKNAALLVLLIGVVLLIFPVLVTRVNPDITLSYLGLQLIALAIVVLSANWFRKRVRLSGTGGAVAIAGWPIILAGLLVALEAFFLMNSVACNCPAVGSCDCGMQDYVIVFDLGVLCVGLGALSIVAVW